MHQKTIDQLAHKTGSLVSCVSVCVKINYHSEIMIFPAIIFALIISALFTRLQFSEFVQQEEATTCRPSLLVNEMDVLPAGHLFHVKFGLFIFTKKQKNKEKLSKDV